LEEILPELDMVLLMSVNPDLGTQFIESSVEKVARLKEMIVRRIFLRSSKWTVVSILKQEKNW